MESIIVALASFAKSPAANQKQAATAYRAISEIAREAADNLPARAPKEAHAKE